ncbi:MAG: hypothetical protein NTW03_05545 [Verrucomicrobia bacterium]|nr:hypothetical protein [Verrucomicrobiota bacterium]
MKMETMNISLTPAMAEYVRKQVGSMYGNVSEFFRDLVRERIEGKQAPADEASDILPPRSVRARMIEDFYGDEPPYR